jgi:hypothetical protein
VNVFLNFSDGSTALSTAEKQLLQKLDPKNPNPEIKPNNPNPEKNPEPSKPEQQLKRERFANKTG